MNIDQITRIVATAVVSCRLDGRSIMNGTRLKLARRNGNGQGRVLRDTLIDDAGHFEGGLPMQIPRRVYFYIVRHDERLTRLNSLRCITASHQQRSFDLDKFLAYQCPRLADSYLGFVKFLLDRFFETKNFQAFSLLSIPPRELRNANSFFLSSIDRAGSENENETKRN